MGHHTNDAMSDTMSVTADEVWSTAGKPFITCECGEPHPLSSWGAAHVGIVPIVKRCGCGRTIRIEVDDA